MTVNLFWDLRPYCVVDMN